MLLTPWQPPGCKPKANNKQKQNMRRVKARAFSTLSDANARRAYYLSMSPFSSFAFSLMSLYSIPVCISSCKVMINAKSTTAYLSTQSRNLSVSLLSLGGRGRVRQTHERGFHERLFPQGIEDSFFATLPYSSISHVRLDKSSCSLMVTS